MRTWTRTTFDGTKLDSELDEVSAHRQRCSQSPPLAASDVRSVELGVSHGRAAFFGTVIERDTTKMPLREIGTRVHRDVAGFVCHFLNRLRYTNHGG